MDRRAFLSLGLLSACLTPEECEEDDDLTQRSGITPWHMWGNTQVFDVPRSSGGASSPLNPTPGQLTRLSYLRPESWHWVFSAKLLAGPDTTGVGEHVNFSILWDLTIGIGRSVILLPAFDTYFFNWNDGAGFPQDQLIWSTQTNGPARSFRTGGGEVSTLPTICSEFVAQDIQLNVRFFLQELSIPSTPVKVELSAQFAPKTHVRPEWFKGGSFPGAEDGGGSSNVAQQLERLNKSNAPIDPADAPQRGELPWHPDAAEQEHYDGEQRELYRDEFGRIMDDDHRARSVPPVIHRPPALQRRILQPHAQLPPPPKPRKRSG